MRLTDENAARFYQVWRPLLTWVNDERNIVPKLFRGPEGAIGAEDAAKIRDVLWSDGSLLARFVALNPAALSPDLLAIAAGWRHRRADTFFVWKHYLRHTIFLDDANAFAVLGLYSTFEEVLPIAPPLMVKAVLLPFEGAIVHDGLISRYNVSLGPGIRRSLLERYRDATVRGAVVKSLVDYAPTTVSETPRRRAPRRLSLDR
jgi:hypothetical protein